jgi:Domain of unknown function (DUF4192)
VRTSGSRLGRRHRGADAVLPGLVGRGGDDAAPSDTADHHRLAAQRGLVTLLDSGEERVQIQMQDRGVAAHVHIVAAGPDNPQVVREVAWRADPADTMTGMTNLSQDPLIEPVRVAGLAELLAGLPVLFGFRPTDSLVVICLEEPRGRVGFRLRVDLPPPDQCGQLARYLVDVLRRNAAGVVLVVACSDEPAVADPAVRALVGRLPSAGIEVRDAVRCDGRRYWSYVCVDPECCPPAGRDYEGAGRLVAEAVWAGMEVLPDRAALAARVGAVDPADVERMERATATAAQELADELGDRDLATMQSDRSLLETGMECVTEIVDRRLVRSDGVTADEELSDADAARLAVWCSLPIVRDTVWARIETTDAPAQLRLWSEVARTVVPPYELPVLALAGFSAWLSGDGALAWCAIERADEIDPDDRLIDLLRSLLIEAVPPSAWEPPSVEQIWRDIRVL